MLYAVLFSYFRVRTTAEGNKDMGCDNRWETGCNNNAIEVKTARMSDTFSTEKQHSQKFTICQMFSHMNANEHTMEQLLTNEEGTISEIQGETESTDRRVGEGCCIGPRPGEWTRPEDAAIGTHCGVRKGATRVSSGLKK